MPGMSGLDCFHRRKKIAPRTKVVLAVGMVAAAGINQLVNDGVWGYINKVCCRQELAVVLPRLIRR